VLALFIIVGIFLFIILAVLCIPFDISLDLNTYGEGRATTKVGWLFGLVRKQISPGKKKVKKPKKKKEVTRAKKKKPEKKRNFKTLLRVLRIKGLLSRIIKFFRQILSCFRVRELDVNLRFGLDDPVDTGITYGLMHAVLIPGNSPGPTLLRIEPVYDRPAFELSLHGRIRVFLIQIVSYFIGFIFSRAGLRTIWSMVVSRWR